MSTDRIEKRVVLRAPRSRVWRAISDAKEFGTWFRITLDGAFAAGKGGTALTIVESGFDRIPLARRAEAFRMNTEGWGGQIKNLERYVS